MPRLKNEWTGVRGTLHEGSLARGPQEVQLKPLCGQREKLGSGLCHPYFRAAAG